MLGREDNAIAEQYRLRGPPPPEPIDTPENCLKGALVHAGLVLLRLDSADAYDEYSAFRQLCVLWWSEEEIEQMKAYLIGTRDLTPGNTERAIYSAAFPSVQRDPQNEAWEGGFVQAALTVVRLQSGGRDEAARDLRQLSSVLWGDRPFQTVLNHVRQHRGAASRREARRYDQAQAGMQAPERESDSEDEHLLQPGDGPDDIWL